jgi:hypothetical protein
VSSIELSRQLFARVEAFEVSTWTWYKSTPEGGMHIPKLEFRLGAARAAPISNHLAQTFAIAFAEEEEEKCSAYKVMSFYV